MAQAGRGLGRGPGAIPAPRLGQRGWGWGARSHFGSVPLQREVFGYRGMFKHTECPLSTQWGQDWAPLSRAAFWGRRHCEEKQGQPSGACRALLRRAAGWCSRSVSLPSLTCCICRRWSLFPMGVPFYSAKPKLRKATTPLQLPDCGSWGIVGNPR